MKVLILSTVLMTLFLFKFAIAFEIGNPAEVDALLSNRNLITKDTILWNKGNDFFGTPSPEISEVEIYIKIKKKHSSLNNIKIIYSNKTQETTLFEEHGSYVNGEIITSIIKHRYFPILLIQTRWQSTGATGDGSDGSNLYVFMYNNKKVEKMKFKLTENGWGGSENTSNYTYLFSGSREIYLFFESMIESKLFKLNHTSLIFKEIEHDFVKKLHPSFDCTKARNEVDLSICKVPALATLDSIMSTLYKSIKIKDGVKSAQKLWIKERNQCKQTPKALIVQCLILKYKNRIIKLSNH